MEYFAACLVPSAVSYLQGGEEQEVSDEISVGAVSRFGLTVIGIIGSKDFGGIAC